MGSISIIFTMMESDFLCQKYEIFRKFQNYFFSKLINLLFFGISSGFCRHFFYHNAMVTLFSVKNWYFWMWKIDLCFFKRQVTNFHFIAFVFICDLKNVSHDDILWVSLEDIVQKFPYFLFHLFCLQHIWHCI